MMKPSSGLTSLSILPRAVRTPTSAARRPFSRTATMASHPQFSAGSDEAALRRELDGLMGSKWSLTQDGRGVERSFKFKTFAKTWDFMTAVSLQCKLKNHHPEWSNVYNTTFIRWTTHNPSGLSAKDTSLAAICDDLAKAFGEIQEEASNDATCQLKELAGTAASTSGDCCTPKK